MRCKSVSISSCTMYTSSNSSADGGGGIRSIMRMTYSGVSGVKGAGKMGGRMCERKVFSRDLDQCHGKASRHSQRTFSCSNFFISFISLRMRLASTLSSNARRIFLMATFVPLFSSKALITTPYAPWPIGRISLNREGISNC